MLPPISPVSAADVSLQSAGQKQENPSASTAPLPAPPTEQDSTLTSPSATVRAVSGQVQLSTSSTVLAETLGKLMNIARMENETAEAYVARLVTSMQSLSANQKAALEQMLGNLLKGLNVAILADALKNASGPEAARLAVIFEFARSLQSNGGTKYSRPSYLQDAMPQVLSLAPMKLIPAPSSQADRGLPAGTSQRLQSTLDQTNPVRPVPAPLNEEHSDQANQPLAIKASTPSLLKNSEGALRPSPLPAAVNGDASSGAASAAKSLLSEAVSDEKQTSKAPFVTAALENDADLDGISKMSGPMPSPTQTQETRLTLETIKQQFSTASAKEMENLLLAILTGKAPAGADSDDATLTLTPRQQETVAEERKSQNPPLPPSTPVADKSLSDVANQLRADTQIAHKSAIAADAKTAVLEQAALQSAVAALVTKEGTPLAFVNYPTEKEEPEADTPPRGRWPSSSDGDQDPEEQAGDQHQEQPEQEERIAANDETVDHSLSIGANEDGRVGEAESYYLKMSSFS